MNWGILLHWQPFLCVHLADWFIQLTVSIPQLYSTILALVSISADRRWSRNSVRHLNTVLCATLAVYAYRDIYPLGTYVLTPQDKDEGSLLWAKISLLTLAGVIIPLSVPREYFPVDRKVRYHGYYRLDTADPEVPQNPKLPTPEQTCSLLSMLVYGFIDSVIIKSYYSPNFLYNDLSPLSDYDYVNYLTKRSTRVRPMSFSQASTKIPSSSTLILLSLSSVGTHSSALFRHSPRK